MTRLRLLFGLLLSCTLGAIAHEGQALRRPISPEQPAWIIHIDVWNYADPQKIIDMVPEDIRPFVIFNIATSSSDDKSANGPAIYDSWMKVCAQNRVWAMIQCASGAANRMPDDGSTTAYEQYFKDYPNFLGFNFAEQFWGFGDEGRVDFPTRLQLFADLMPICHQYGGYLAVSFCDSYYSSSKMPIAYLKRNQQMRTFLQSDPEHFLCFEKYTLKKNFLDIESQCLGQWLGGYAGQYGIRFDSSGWLAASDETDQTKGGSDFVRAAGAIPVVEHMMLTGQTMMDGPELTWTQCSQETATTTSGGYTQRNWGWFPQFKSISLDIFRKVLDGTIRIPTKQEVISRTRVCLVNDKNSNLTSEGEHNSYITPENLFDGLYRSATDQGGAANGWLTNRWWMKSTGRYPTIPMTYGEVSGMQTFKKTTFNKTTFDNWMKEHFPEEYTGDLFAGRHENGWVTYNPYQYDESKAEGYRVCSKNTQRATGTIPLQYNTCTSVQLDYAPYSLGVMKEHADRIDFYLTNYEGGKDIIKINGATSKPSYTKDDRGSETSTVEESWSDGVYMLTITHQGGAVDLTINCAGGATSRKTAPEPKALSTAPALPDAYTGILQYEAELADYKNATIRKSGYNQGRDGYQGQGFAELNNTNSTLRFNVTAPQSGYYLLTLRYQADANTSIKTADETLTLAKTDGWATVQTIILQNEGKGTIVVQNGSSQRLYVDNITLESIKAETFTTDENGEFHVALSDLIASGTISINAATGVVTQSTGGQYASGSLRLFFDHADFTEVTELKVTYEGDGEIFKYLTISDNYGNTANPNGSQGAFWNSRYSLDYTNYQQAEASKLVCKLEWTANAPESAPRTMTIKDIVIKGRNSSSAIDEKRLERATPIAYYNLQGQVMKKAGQGINILRLSDGKSIKVNNQ